MIVLGKDKVDERFNILVDGTIVDLEGNIQELKIHQGYLEFNHVGVHKIQIWSNFGWKDGHKFVIHHIDENKLNNSLSNLKILSHAHHTYLHKKGKSWYMSKEGKKNISKATKGENNPMYGKHHSEKSKQKIREDHKGRHWFNDGIKNYFCKECPEGCIPGRKNF